MSSRTERRPTTTSLPKPLGDVAACCARRGENRSVANDSVARAANVAKTLYGGGCRRRRRRRLFRKRFRASPFRFFFFLFLSRLLSWKSITLICPFIRGISRYHI